MSGPSQTAATAVQNAQSVDLSAYARLRPAVFGPQAALFRYSVAAERQTLGAYTGSALTNVAWPGLPVGATPDLAYTKVYLANAWLRYLNKAIGTSGTAIPPASADRVRSNTLVFKTGNGGTLSAGFYGRPVAVGDIVRLTATVASVVYTHTTSVTGFVGEAVASTRGAAGTGPGNAGSQVSSGPTYAQTADTPANYVEISASGGTYSSLADGVLTRTYTISVIQAGSGGDATTARLKVVSSDGGDDVASVTPAAFASATAVGTKGLTLTFVKDNTNSVDAGVDPDDFVVGQVWTVSVGQAFTPTTPTAAGTYTGPTSRTYIATVTTGGTLASGTAQLRVTTSDGGDQSAALVTVPAAATPVSIGSFGVTLAFAGGTGLRKGDVYTVTVTAATEGAYQTLTLRDQVPGQLVSVDCALELMAPVASVELPRTRLLPSATTDWTATTAAVTVNAGAQLPVTGMSNAGAAVYAPVVGGTAYVHYRAWRAGTGTVYRAATLADAATYFGPNDPDNPLGFAAATALDNTAGVLLAAASAAAASSTNVVVGLALTGVPTDTAAWTTALETLKYEGDAYQFVPASADLTVHALVAAAVADASTPATNRFTRAFFPAVVAESVKVTPASTLTATVAAGAGGNTAVTAAAGANFVTAGVRAGDVLRINYSVDAFGAETYEAYAVASVQTETTLTLAAGPAAPVGVGVRFEVWRTPTKAELVAQVVAQAAAYRSQRISVVWADGFRVNGTAVPGWAGCAAAAGLVGSVPSHQSVSGTGLAGLDATTRGPGYFTAAQLRQLAAGGVFVLADDPAGGVFVTAANTTDPSTVYTREETAVRNADCVRHLLADAMAGIRQVANISDVVGEFARVRAEQLVERLKTRNTTRLLGSPVARLELTGSAQVVGVPDAVTLSFRMTGPTPLNQTYIDLTLANGL